MIRKILKLLLKVFFWFFGLSIGLVIVFKFIPVPFTPLMFIRTFEQMSSNQKVVWKHDWVDIDKISINMQKAVIASEDGKFTSHGGFDLDAIKKAYKDNKKGKSIKGGSTITQQTAKNVFLWPGRNVLRKAFEAYFTILIEVIWGKERIMEVYLNSVEMGNGIYGVEAASNYWFGKSAEKLTKRESAAIAAILPNPRKYKATNSSKYINKRINLIMKQMNLYPLPDYDN